jgi:Asp-tRNA(Asn)/Glu-tRNA(Gln) amidotransferase C subunit
MSADDDGFCNQVSISMFKAHASIQDLQALLEKRYIYQFENGVIVIKHWRMANALRKDRYTPTAFQEELSHLDIKDNGSYTWLPSGCQVVANRLPQDRIGKDRLDKVSLVDNIVADSDESQPTPKKQKHKYGEYNNVLLTDEELQKLKAEYSDFEERIERLSSYVASTGKKYKSHYATIRNWARKDAETKPIRKEPTPKWMPKTQNNYDFDELEKALAPVMVADDPKLKEEAEALKRELQEKY